MVVVSALRGDSVAAAVEDELFSDDGSGVDLETFFDHAALDEAAAGGAGAKSGEEEELEWLSNKDAFPAVETMLPPPAPAPAAPRTTKGAPRPEPVVEKKAAAAGKRCRHCGTEKSPQWRAGPEGGGTLCNACGLRFRSGRLVPEYRPVSSPTFSPRLHSNCHRRVVEMRRQRYVAAMTTSLGVGAAASTEK
ncbi:unnamed protein product [Urochloa decumbens]|uniref:GATA-type domain-containing protein n=1 Tax=Urochloa decumbens TaxID=240449 RepID=A0ABC8XYI9_9POAL